MNLPLQSINFRISLLEQLPQVGQLLLVLLARHSIIEALMKEIGWTSLIRLVYSLNGSRVLSDLTVGGAWFKLDLNENQCV